MKKILCSKCKKEIEEEKPNYFLSLMGWVMFILIIVFISMGVFLISKGTEIFSLGERIIMIYLMVFLSFAFFIPFKWTEEIKKSYELPTMKKYKWVGKCLFIPYLLAGIYFFIILLTFKVYDNLLQWANLFFIIIWGIPLLDKFLNKKIFRKKK